MKCRFAYSVTRKQLGTCGSEPDDRCGKFVYLGIDIVYEVLGEANGMLMVTASGTAVVFE